MALMTINDESNELLSQLKNEYNTLKSIINDLENRTNSAKIQGAFQFQIKKTKNIIQELTKLIKLNNKNISHEFIKEYQQICINLEEQYNTGINIINRRSSEDVYNIKHTGITNNELNNDNKIQKNEVKFVEYNENNDNIDKNKKILTQIDSIYDELHSVKSLTNDLNELINNQQNDINELQNNISETKENVTEAANTLFAIKRSRITYGIIGGIGAIILGGGPAFLLASSVKIAIGSTVGAGLIGAGIGSKYADKTNDNQKKTIQEFKESMNNINNNETKQDLNESLLNNNNNNNNNNSNNNDINIKANKSNNNSNRFSGYLWKRKSNPNKSQSALDDMLMQTEPLPWDPKN